MVEDEIAPPLGRNTYIWIETVVVLLVCIVPAIFSSMASIYLLDGTSTQSFAYHALSAIVRSTGRIAVVLFVIWKSKEPPGCFGLKPFRALLDLLGAGGIFIACRLTRRLVWVFVPMVISHAAYMEILRHPFHPNYLPPSGVGEYLLLAIATLAIGMGEELVVRAYLITRFEQLLESTPLALLLTTVIFASYHGYEGTGAVIRIALDGLLYGVAFCLLRRIWPVALAHALFDFYAEGGFAFF
jgi:membrane protease YdiL (CAAX protease family)